MARGQRSEDNPNRQVSRDAISMRDPFKGLGGTGPAPQRRSAEDAPGDFNEFMSTRPGVKPPPQGRVPYKRTPEYDRGSKSRLSLRGDRRGQAGR